MVHQDPESLLDEARWLQRVARDLVRDEHVADDLAQDALLAAHTHGQTIRTERRAWLFGTLQRLVARTFRSRARRLRREDLVAPRGEAPSAAELTARAELHEQLLQHVRALPEHYRVVLLLRYYDALPPRRIAHQLGLSVRTVHTRLLRGLELLRERLDAGHPRGRAGWVAVLWCAAPRGGWPWSVKAAAVSATAALAATTAFVLWPTPAAPLAQRTEIAVAPTASPTAAAPAAAERLPAHIAEPAATTAEQVGNVVDWLGYPVPDARVMIAAHHGLLWPDASGEPDLVAGPSQELPMRTDRNGAFLWMPTAGVQELRAEVPGALTVLVPIWRAEQGRAPRIVTAPAMALQGKLVDEHGTSVAGAELQVALVADFDAVAQRGTQGLYALHWAATADSQGCFGFAAVPAIDEARLSVRAQGYEPMLLPVRDLPREPLVLSRWRTTVAGRLLGSDGAPLAGACVATAHCAITTDRDGAFLVQGDAAEPLFAAAVGLGPSRLADLPAGQAHMLAAPALQFVGVLRRDDGTTLPRGLVSLVDATVVGAPDAPCVLEAIAAGDRRLLHLAEADAQGAFRLGGLSDRPYRLRIVDPATAAWFETEPLHPGVVEILVPASLTRPQHTVLLHTADGGPLAGATVTVQATSYLLHLPNGLERDVVFAAGSSGRTDGAGAVTLHDVPRHGAHLRIAHPAVGLAYVDLADAGESSYVLERKGEVVVRLAAHRGDEWAELLAADGTPLDVQCLSGVSMRIASRWQLARGHSPVLQAPTNAVEVRITSPRGELVRLPLAVRPGERIAVDG